MTDTANAAAPAWVCPPITWDPSPNFNSRGGCAIDQIIIHRCQGTGIGSEEYFDTRASDVSAQFIVFERGEKIVQQVAIANRAWHACIFNSRSIGIELAGYEEKGFEPGQLETSRRFVAYLAREYKIPIRRAKAGVGPGIESHWGLGVPGGRHADPEPNDAWINQFVADVAAIDPATLPASGTWVPVGQTSIHTGPLDLSTYEGVQRALNALGAAPTLDEDNEPGPLTEAAVMAFQKAHGLDADGDPGPATKAAILKALSGG